MEKLWEFVELDHPYASISIKEEPDIESLQTELIIKEEIKDEFDETSDKYLSSVMNLESELIIKEELKDDYNETCGHLGSIKDLERTVSNTNFDHKKNFQKVFLSFLLFQKNKPFVYENAGVTFKTKASVTKHLRNSQTYTLLTKSNHKITHKEYEFKNLHSKPTSNQYLGQVMNLEHTVLNTNFNGTRYVKDDLNKQFVCKHCGAILKKASHTKNFIPSMFCDRRCAILSKSRDIITLRKYRFLNSNSSPFKCTTCDRVFSNKLSVMAHDIKEHVGEKYFTCTYCKQTFTERNDLLTHNIKLHPSDKPQKLHIKWRRRNNNQFLYKRPRP